MKSVSTVANQLIEGAKTNRVFEGRESAQLAMVLAMCVFGDKAEREVGRRFARQLSEAGVCAIRQNQAGGIGGQLDLLNCSESE